MQQSPSDDRPYPGTALVTGGGSGLGFAIAQELVNSGYHVIITGRDHQRLAAAANSLGERAVAEVCDVSDPTEVEDLRSRVTDDVSILINNAGIGGPVSPLVDIEPTSWDEVFDINVRGVYLMCRAFAPGMMQRRDGYILNIASVTGKRPLTNRTPYAASKMAVIGLTSTLAFELSPHNIMVNSLSPGPLVSERMARNFDNEARLSGRSVKDVTEEFISRAALLRMLTPEEIARSVVASLSMPGLTGSDLDLSGGMIA